MTNDTYSGNRHMYVGIEHILTHLISWKYSKMGHFPTRNITYFKLNGVFQH